MSKKQNDALASVFDSEELKQVKDILSDATVRGWSVFDHDGVDIESEGVSETVTAVYSNAIDLADHVANAIEDTSAKPRLSFMKGVREVHTESFEKANVIVLKDKKSGASQEAQNGR